MSLTRVSATTLHRDLETHETATERVMGTAVRAFLTNVRDAAINSLPVNALVAAGGTPITLGQVYGWWTAEVLGRIDPHIHAVWISGYERRTDAVVTSTSMDELATYMAAVRDRLVRGLTPPLPDEAFNAVRSVITEGAALGWSITRVAEGIAAELSWERREPYWRAQVREADAAIDALLDPLGPPGTPAREYARENDPRVRVWQAAKARATRALDAESTYWRARATLIARTESTGAYNYGALTALTDEGVACKRWLATLDARTRPTHRGVDGQVVRVRGTFDVGGVAMRMPGDPSAPPAEVCNCRCTIVQADCDGV